MCQWYFTLFLFVPYMHMVLPHFLSSLHIHQESPQPHASCLEHPLPQVFAPVCFDLKFGCSPAQICWSIDKLETFSVLFSSIQFLWHPVVLSTHRDPHKFVYTPNPCIWHTGRITVRGPVGVQPVFAAMEYADANIRQRLDSEREATSPISLPLCFRIQHLRVQEHLLRV